MKALHIQQDIWLNGIKQRSKGSVNTMKGEEDARGIYKLPAQVLQREKKHVYLLSDNANTSNPQTEAMADKSCLEQ